MAATSCNNCGACCNPVMLRFTLDDVRRSIPAESETTKSMLGQTMNSADRAWMLEALIPIPFREGMAGRPELRGRPLMDIGPDGPVDSVAFFYRCRHYDTEARTCGIYENRPPICEGFPWYGNRPHPAATIPPACEFNRDVGRVPVELTRRP